MKKPKMKVKELKPRIKVIRELSGVETPESLETMVNMEEDSPMVPSNPAEKIINPSLTQRFQAQERNFEEGKKEEKKREEAIMYHTLNQQTSSRSYDPSIRSSGNLTASQQAAVERIDPSLQNSA